jgi:hypothetical protein
VCGHDGQVGALCDVPQGADVGGWCREKLVVCKTKSDETAWVEALVLRHALQLADLLVPAPGVRNIVDGMSVHGADATVDGSVHTAVGALLRPTCVGMVEDGGSTDMHTFQAARELAQVEVLRSEHRR